VEGYCVLGPATGRWFGRICCRTGRHNSWHGPPRDCVRYARIDRATRRHARPTPTASGAAASQESALCSLLTVFASRAHVWRLYGPDLYRCKCFTLKPGTNFADSSRRCLPPRNSGPSLAPLPNRLSLSNPLSRSSNGRSNSSANTAPGSSPMW
jgi:hypothetical protein